MNNRAFTLTEILIALAVLGILAALITPHFTGSVEQGRASGAVGILNAVWQGEETWRDDNGVYRGWPATTFPVDTIGAPCDDIGEWNALGMNANPNDSGNSFFDYCVYFDQNQPDQFLAVAERRDVPPGTGFVNQTICLNQDGVWSGKHPLRQQNANNGICGTPPDFPGPCCTAV